MHALGLVQRASFLLGRAELGDVCTASQGAWLDRLTACQHAALHLPCVSSFAAASRPLIPFFLCCCGRCYTLKHMLHPFHSKVQWPERPGAAFSQLAKSLSPSPAVQERVEQLRKSFIAAKRNPELALILLDSSTVRSLIRQEDQLQMALGPLLHVAR